MSTLREPHRDDKRGRRRGSRDGLGRRRGSHDGFDRRGSSDGLDRRGGHDGFDRRDRNETQPISTLREPGYDDGRRHRRGSHDGFDRRGSHDGFDRRGSNAGFDRRGSNAGFDRRGSRDDRRAPRSSSTHRRRVDSDSSDHDDSDADRDWSDERHRGRRQRDDRRDRSATGRYRREPEERRSQLTPDFDTYEPKEYFRDRRDEPKDYFRDRRDEPKDYFRARRKSAEPWRSRRRSHSNAAAYGRRPTRRTRRGEVFGALLSYEPHRNRRNSRNRRPNRRSRSQDPSRRYDYGSGYAHRESAYDSYSLAPMTAREDSRDKPRTQLALHYENIGLGGLDTLLESNGFSPHKVMMLMSIGDLGYTQEEVEDFLLHQTSDYTTYEEEDISDDDEEQFALLGFDEDVKEMKKSLFTTNIMCAQCLKQLKDYTVLKEHVREHHVANELYILERSLAILKYNKTKKKPAKPLFVYNRSYVISKDNSKVFLRDERDERHGGDDEMRLVKFGRSWLRSNYRQLMFPYAKLKAGENPTFDENLKFDKKPPSLDYGFLRQEMINSVEYKTLPNNDQAKEDMGAAFDTWSDVEKLICWYTFRGNKVMNGLLKADYALTLRWIRPVLSEVNKFIYKRGIGREEFERTSGDEQDWKKLIRDMTITDGLQNALKVGTRFRTCEYWSFAWGDHPGSGFDGNTQFYLETPPDYKWGCKIKQWSIFDDEEERIFMPGVIFEVRKRYPKKTHKTKTTQRFDIVALDEPFKKGAYNEVDDVIAEQSYYTKEDKGKGKKKYKEDEWLKKTRKEMTEYLGKPCIIDKQA